MVTSLEEEAKADATEKACCHEQLAKTEELKADLEHDLGKLTTKIDMATSNATLNKGQFQSKDSACACVGMRLCPVQVSAGISAVVREGEGESESERVRERARGRGRGK